MVEYTVFVCKLDITCADCIHYSKPVWFSEDSGHGNFRLCCNEKVAANDDCSYFSKIKIYI